MSVIGNTITFLEGLGEDHKEQAEALKLALKEHSGVFNKLEENEREAKAIKEQLGDTPIADLLTANQFVIDNGGVEKIAGWKGTGEEAKLEIKQIQADNLRIQEANDQKFNASQESLRKANVHNSFMGKYGSNFKEGSMADILTLSGADIDEVGGVMTYNGKPMEGAGIEELKTRHALYINSPTGGGGDGLPKDQPTPEKRRKITFH
ncbi:MAG: hypothetical protein GY799_12220 [Desulfobulbaceae bacterium]|nr:hypothetical protein [Desulfobulbaceae bacterium]